MMTKEEELTATLGESIANVGMILGSLIAIEDNILKNPKQSKENLHLLNKEIADYLKAFGLPVEKEMDGISKIRLSSQKRGY
jgi:hypothetical protein